MSATDLNLPVAEFPIVSEPTPVFGQRAPWFPPVTLWQLWLLCVLSFGIYVFFWVYRVAKDMQRHVRKDISPGMYVLGACIPIAGPFVAYKQHAQISQLNNSAGQRLAPAAWCIVVLVICNYVAGTALQISDNLPTIFVYLTISPIPCLLMQRKLNAYKLTLLNANWVTHPFRFTKLQYIALVLGGAIFALALYGSLEEMGRWQGQAMSAGSVVSGTKAPYHLTIPNNEWRSVAPGTIGEGSDLDTYGASVETFLIVYVHDNQNLSLDDIVDSRREQIRESESNFSFSEERIMLDNGWLPVSYARYTNKSMLIGEQVWWVATVVTEDDFGIEAVAYTQGQKPDEKAIETLVRSLRLTPGPITQ